MDPNLTPLYAGFTGAQFPVEQFDFGHGVTLRKTYAHVMAPYLAAFKPAEPGKHHPAPWKAVAGGHEFDIQWELYIPLDLALPNWFDRVNTAWWFAALLRLKAAPLLRLPVIASSSFTEIPLMFTEPEFWSVEMRHATFAPIAAPTHSVAEADLHWIAEHWIDAGRLMNEKSDFNIAFQAADECIWIQSPSLGLVSLWGALERLFCPSFSELSFRVSATIASYLEPRGQQRLASYRLIKKLYDSRSKAAHGAPIDEAEPFTETYALLKRAILKMIEQNHVPTREELEFSLVGGGNLD